MGFHHPVCMDTSWFTLVSCFFGFSLKSLDTHGCTKSGSRLQKCIQDVFNAFNCGADPFFGAFTFSIFSLCFWSLCLRLWRSKRTFMRMGRIFGKKNPGTNFPADILNILLGDFLLALRFVLWPEGSKNSKIQDWRNTVSSYNFHMFFVLAFVFFVFFGRYFSFFR